MRPAQNELRVAGDSLCSMHERCICAPAACSPSVLHSAPPCCGARTSRSCTIIWLGPPRSPPERRPDQERPGASHAHAHPPPPPLPSASLPAGPQRAGKVQSSSRSSAGPPPARPWAVVSPGPGPGPSPSRQPSPRSQKGQVPSTCTWAAATFASCSIVRSLIPVCARLFAVGSFPSIFQSQRQQQQQAAEASRSPLSFSFLFLWIPTRRLFLRCRLSLCGGHYLWKRTINKYLQRRLTGRLTAGGVF